MNRYLPVLFLLITALSQFGCASSKTVFEVPQKMNGEIMVVGNEPFTKLAVRTDSGEIYLISCNQEVRQTLLSHQGKIAELSYDEIDKENSSEQIRVVKVNFNSK